MSTRIVARKRIQTRLAMALGWRVQNIVLAGRPTHWAGYEGTVLGGEAVSLITCPERGIAVAVISNIPHGDPSSLAMRIAHAFAEPGSSPARR